MKNTRGQFVTKWSSVAAILGPMGPFTATKIAVGGPGRITYHREQTAT